MTKTHRLLKKAVIIIYFTMFFARNKTNQNFFFNKHKNSNHFLTRMRVERNKNL